MNAKILLAAATTIILSGCGVPFDFGTPEQQAAYYQQLNQQSGQLLAQSTATLQQQSTIQAPQAAPIGQQTTTVTAYCNQLSDNITNCRVR